MNWFNFNNKLEIVKVMICCYCGWNQYHYRFHNPNSIMNISVVLNDIFKNNTTKNSEVVIS